MRYALRLLVTVASLVFASFAQALPTFDLIVPSEIRLTIDFGTASGIAVNGGLWVVATEGTLTAEEFSNSLVSIAVDDSRIRAVGGFLNESNWMPLLPGQVVGETAVDNDYLSLLRAGESFVAGQNPFFWQLEFPSYTDVIGSHAMSWNIRVDDQLFSFSSILNLAPVGPYDLGYAGQRITSTPVPEPSTHILLGLGLAGLGLSRRRKAA